MVMNMNLSWLEPYITVASQIVLTVGLWAMLKKCGNKGWYALIPGFRWYALSDCVGRESSGTGAMIVELTYLMPVTFKKYRNIWCAKIGGTYLKTDNHTDGYYAAASIGIYY